MVLYFSDNKETEHKKKGVFYEGTLPENAVIFGSTTLKKYNGGPADYMKIGAKRYYIDEPVSERDVIGYIPVVAERYPSAPSETIDPTKNKYGYIQVKECYPFLPYILPILLLLILLVLIVRSVGGSGFFKNNVVLPDKHEQPSVSIENKETIKEPDKNQNPIQPTASTKESEKEEKNTSVAVLPINPVIVPGNKLAAKPVSIITPTATPSPEPESTALKPTDTSDDSITPAPTTTPHVHTYVVEEQAATCTDLGFYKKYCSECGYVVADHTCTALGHTNSVASVSNMTYPDGMAATYVCDRCNETVKDNFDYTAGLYKADGSLLYTYDALEELFDWNLSTTPVKEQMDAHTELADGRILVLPNWEYLSKVAEESGETNAIYSKDGTMQSDGKYHLAFSNTVLTEVVLPDDTPYLGNWFIEANNIEKIELPDSITEYRGGIYQLDNLKYLKVSAGVPEINGHFSSCSNVETLIIPEGVTSVYGVNFPQFGENVTNGMNVSLPSTLKKFGDCFNAAKIKKLVLPGSIEELYPIVSIEGIKELIFEYGIKEIPAYFYPKDTLEKVVISGSVKKIGESAFLATTNTSGSLKEITLEEGIEEIGSNFIQSQNNLKQLIIPNSVKSLTNQIAVSNNMNLVILPKEVSFDNMPIVNINNRSSSTWDGTPGHIIMPNNITRIAASSSFIIWDSLEEIVLPGGDYSGCNSLFQNCNNLKKITFTSEITGLNKNFFRYIPSVTDIYYYGSEESINKLINTYRTENPTENPYILFMNATIHYMTGTPPTREDLMKEYGVEKGVYGLYSDETYVNAVERYKTENTSLTASPVEMLQLSETQLFDSTKEDTQKSVKTEAHTHSLSIDEKAPTCTEDGYYRVTCSACGEVLADHVCKKLGHNMQMIDPEDNTADIMVPRFKCNRCDYTESTNHTHNWIAKGYENMTYPDGGDAVYVCTTCLNKKTEHCDAVPGIYDETGALMYTYNELEEQFNWNLSTTPAKDIMDAHTELGNGRILLLPSWQHLSEVATESGADCGLIKGGNGINPCFTESILTEVILPNDCNDFGNWFCASNVTKIELPDSITDYKGSSISGANKLKTLKLSAGAKDLSNFGVHSNSELEEIIIPEGVEKLGSSTFAGNNKLKTVTLPSTLTDIGNYAFASTGLEYLEIPACIKEIGTSNHSLAGMSSLKTLVLNDGLEKIGNGAFQSLLALETINIPKSVTEMGNTILSGLQNLKSVTFEDGLTKIGNTLFVNSRIEKIIIPNSVKDIPENLFTGAENLKLIVLPEEVDCMGGNGLFSCGCNSDELKIIMPTTVKEWRAGVALCSSKLKEVVLPGNVDYPVGLVNNGCGLEKVVITSEPNSIAYGAFGNLHNADIYYYGSKESVEKFNADAGDKDVFFLTDNNNRLHYMTGNPPTREDQMNGIDYNSLEEATTQSITSGVPAAEETSLPAVVSLPVTEETTDTTNTNTSESTDNTEETKPLKSVSDGDAK